MEPNITARDELLGQVLGLVSKPFSDSSESHLSLMLDRFRLQLKSGADLPGGKTAREALYSEVTQLWQTARMAADDVRKLIDRYRMQLKAPAKAKGTKTAATPKKKERESVTLQAVSKKPTRVEPLAGGPQKRSRDRGQCPKCHSMGVVLAHSFSGDDYFSCIYCGFQAYKGTLDSELDLPLAAELLGRRFDDREEAEHPG